MFVFRTLSRLGKHLDVEARTRIDTALRLLSTTGLLMEGSDMRDDISAKDGR